MGLVSSEFRNPNLPNKDSNQVEEISSSPDKKNIASIFFKDLHLQTKRRQRTLPTPKETISLISKMFHEDLPQKPKRAYNYYITRHDGQR